MANRVHRLFAVSGLCLLMAGCSHDARSADTGALRNSGVTASVISSPMVGTPRATPVSTQLSVPLPLVPEPRPALSGSADRLARDMLLASMRQSLGGVLLPENIALTRAAVSAGQAMMARMHTDIDSPQVLLLVDRSPAVQRLWVVVVSPGKPWEELGSIHVSTGKPGRKEHFRTPVGVFVNDASILGYRALGTFNEFHIRGIGVKGMRVWDFGWQTTDDWRTAGAPMAIRMEMHATDPANLELRLGHWDSEGCIRIPSRFNSFMDQHGLIDAKVAEAAQSDRRFAALLPKGITPTPLAGSVVVVVDTSDPAALPSDPVKANAMEHPDMAGPEHDDAG